MAMKQTKQKSSKPARRTRHMRFSAAEIILGVILIIGLVVLGYALWQTSKANEKADKAPAVAQAPKPDPYEGWHSYTLANSQVNFHYPSKWQITDSSDQYDDQVNFAGDNGFSAEITFGTTGHPSLDYQPVVRYAKEQLFKGKFDANGRYSLNKTAWYLDFIGGTPKQAKDGKVYGVQVSTSKTKALATPIFGKYAVDIHAQTAKPLSLAAAKTNPDYQDFYRLIASLNKAH